MEEIRELFKLPAPISPVGPLTVLISLVVGAVLSYLIALVYIRTHKEEGYLASFVQSLVFLGIVVAAIMLIIGNNVVRAFGLIGAVAIIRFRTRIKDPQDTAFLFFSIGIGMACGLRLYSIALITTAFTSGVILLLWKVRFGKSVGVVSTTGEEGDTFLQVKLIKNLDAGKKLVSESLEEITKGWKIVGINVNEDSTTIKYKIKLKGSPEELIHDLKERGKESLAELEYYTK